MGSDINFRTGARIELTGVHYVIDYSFAGGEKSHLSSLQASSVIIVLKEKHRKSSFF